MAFVYTFSTHSTIWHPINRTKGNWLTKSAKFKDPKWAFVKVPQHAVFIHNPVLSKPKSRSIEGWFITWQHIDWISVSILLGTIRACNAYKHLNSIYFPSNTKLYTICIIYITHGNRSSSPKWNSIITHRPP